MESMRRHVRRRVAVAKPSASGLPSGQPENPQMNRIDAPTLHGWITDGRELAVLDAREDGEFGASHLFWAVPCEIGRAHV
jgi:hypothetical protein